MGGIWYSMGMTETMTEQEWCERRVRRYFGGISIPRTTRTNWREFACAWMSKHGGTYRNGVDVWRVTYHEEHSRDLSRPYIPL